jgi:hypothetical protein
VLNGGTAVRGRMSAHEGPERTPVARKPALGPSFAFMADATLWLARAPVSVPFLPPESGDADEEDELRATDADGDVRIADADADEEARARTAEARGELRVAEVLRSKMSVRACCRVDARARR